MKSASFDKQPFITFPCFRVFAICNYSDFPFSLLKGIRDSFCRSLFEVLHNMSTFLHTVI
jgi:hypothetical protein